jgi:hypothetical protein
MFTGPDGRRLFKVIDVGSDERLRWAHNLDQDLAEGEYF